MGSSEAGAQSKTTKLSQTQPASSASTPATPVYPDWSSFQAYSPVPYMWGAQPMMPPYGTPPPYVMYPPGSLYPHPSMPPGTSPYSPFVPPSNGNTDGHGAAPGNSEANGKNNNEPGKTSGASGNGAVSQSGESGSESSSEGSDSDNDSTPKANARHECNDETSNKGGSGKTRGNQNGASQTVPVMPVPGAGPATNLNIGLDYWGGAAAAAAAAASQYPAAPVHGKLPSAPAATATIVPIQDERELKRQRRKQSNRESARRSRLRKQAECEELAQRADILKEENATLRTEVDQVKKKYEDLLAENKSLKEKLGLAENENTKNSGGGDANKA